jgi:hypothetical protein
MLLINREVWYFHVTLSVAYNDYDNSSLPLYNIGICDLSCVLPNSSQQEIKKVITEGTC